MRRPVRGRGTGRQLVLADGVQRGSAATRRRPGDDHGPRRQPTPRDARRRRGGCPHRVVPDRPRGARLPGARHRSEAWSRHLQGVRVPSGTRDRDDPSGYRGRSVATVFVAGARDDILRPVYEANRRGGDVLSNRESPLGGRLISASDIPNRATSSFHGDVAVMLALLERAGIERILVRELDAAAFECSVVRVLVPGLESYQFPWVAAGERARSFDPSVVAG